MNCGVVYIVCSRPGHKLRGSSPKLHEYLSQATESSNSARRLGYKTCLLTDANEGCRPDAFDLVKQVKFTLTGYNAKAEIIDLSPFDVTLCLDCDTLVMGDIEFGFRQAARHGLAVCLAPLYCLRTESNRYEYPIDAGNNYNTGVLFLMRRPDTAKLYARWRELIATNLHRPPPPGDDQFFFSQAVHEVNFNPFVLPPSWNFTGRPPTDITCRFCYLHGPCKIWHNSGDPPLPVPANLADYNAEASRRDFRQARVAVVEETYPGVLMVRYQNG